MTHIRRKSALERIERALTSSRSMGYEVLSEERQDIRGNWSGWLVGTCGSGHDFEMATDKWLKGQRCTPCRREAHIAHWMQIATEAGYVVSPVTRPSTAGNHVWFVGQCAKGHPVNDLPSRMFRGEGCIQCYLSRAEAGWLATAEEEGYRVVCVREEEGARNKPYLVGHCPADHAFRIRASHWVTGSRCKECNKYSLAEVYATAARSEGYDVSVEFRSKGAVLVGTCPRGHAIAMQTYVFKDGGRCGECRLEALRAERLAVALAEGYDVAMEFRDNGKQNITWLVGRCPEGHDFQMSMTRFAAGRRCPSLAKSGFDSTKPAHLYVVSGGGLVKFGISNVLSNRLAMHERSGFTEWMALVYCDDGELIQRVESMLKRWLPSNAPTCYAKGMRFDGATEAFALSDFEWRYFDQLLFDALDQVDASTQCAWYAADTGLFPATRTLGMRLAEA